MYYTLMTNYNPRTYIKSSSKINATGQRWIKELTNFNFTVCYKLDVGNVVADTLSRSSISNAEDLQAF